MLDNDSSAINRARVNVTSLPLAQGIDSIGFLHKNALRFSTEEKYDLIWCSGLFDYLSDKIAIFLIKRLLGLLNPKGVLCIGNFGLDNPSRSYMEVVGEWFLIHRSGRDLEKIATAAGMNPKSRILADDNNINLFLVGGSC